MQVLNSKRPQQHKVDNNIIWQADAAISRCDYVSTMQQYKHCRLLVDL